MTKQTTQMNHPYELFAYQVGQDMKSLIARIEALETQPHGEPKPATTSGQISVLALQTVVPSAIYYPEDEAKLASGNYVVNTDNTDFVIHVGKQYAGWEADGVKVNEEGLLKLHNSNYQQGEVVNLTLTSPVKATSVLYNHIREVDLNRLVSVTDVTYKFEHNTLSELKLHGVLENGKAASRYLNRESDYLQVVKHYSDGRLTGMSDNSYPNDLIELLFNQNGEKPSEGYHMPEEIDYIELTISHKGFSKTITLHNEGR